MFCYGYFASSFADALPKTLNSSKQLIGYFDAFLKKIIHREFEKKSLTQIHTFLVVFSKKMSNLTLLDFEII
jgi:hypothetical protein